MTGKNTSAARRVAHAAMAGIALSIFAVSSAVGQSVLTVDTEISGEAYLSRLAEILDDINRLAPDSVAGEGPLLTILPDGDIAAIDGYAGLSQTDRQLAAAGRRLFDLYREIGGNAGDRPLLIQRTAAGLFSALEGATGNVSDSVGEALDSSLDEIAAADDRLPGAVAPVVEAVSEALANRAAADPAFDLLKELEPDPIAVLARNRRVNLTVTGPDVTNAGPDAVIAGPPDSTIGTTRISGDRLETNIVIGPATPDGFAKLFLFSGSDSLSPVAGYDIAVSGGEADAPQVEADDHGNTPATATTLLGDGTTSGTIAGQMGGESDIDMFQIVITTSGTLSIVSSGPTDVNAQLIGDKGEILADDDDSGERYNFALAAPVSPGTYTLSVRHCCDGTGSYQISTILNPL